MLLVKNPQFSSNQADSLPKLPIHELVILTKWHNDRVKIVDIFQRANFLASPIFYSTYFIFFTFELNSVQAFPSVILWARRQFLLLSSSTFLPGLG